jgi:hypothetical protein
MPQYTFTSDEDFIIKVIDELARKAKRTRSEMIDILLHYAVKEKLRKKKPAKENNTQNHS